MAQRLLASIAFVALFAGVCTAQSLGAEPGASERETLDSYCSPSGDYCTAVKVKKDRLRFEVRAFAPYFAEYKVCVKGPGGGRECAESQLHEAAGNKFKDSIDYLKHFTAEGPGDYKVVWKIPGSRLGDPLFFSAGAE